jgi:ubiquinol-cytochrome c reductase iron-sulfur subunit
VAVSRRDVVFGAGLFGAGMLTAAVLTPGLQRLTSLWFRIANNPATLTNREVDVSQLPPGQLMSTVWQNLPIYIWRRTEGMLSQLAERTSEVRFPEPIDALQPVDASNQFRSVDPLIFVVRGICSRAGCPLIAFEADRSDLLPGGGFLCTNDGSRFDAAGRVYAGSPAPVDLLVPPHFYRDDKTLVIGEKGSAAA